MFLYALPYTCKPFLWKIAISKVKEDTELEGKKDEEMTDKDL